MNHIAGFLAGLTASMGLGGGFILIIYLSFFSDISQSAAGGINLLFFLPVALVSAILHLRSGLIERKILLVICLAGIAGAVVGSFVMDFLDEALLRKLFAGLLVFVGLRELLRTRSANKISAKKFRKTY
ncbi:MAG: sulfite exporter TauE/SafE family protein [Oscillospiraceae bacterium]|nr:sulfite exporter TauE/SafE family protein [Oscillospiraceae bacterium]